MTGIKNRLEKLEELQQLDNLIPLFVATEIVPGCYRLDDGRELDTTELDALPGSGPGLHGLIICMPEAEHEA